MFIYIAQFALTALLGAVLGCVAAALLCDTIIGFFSVMFEVPGLAFVFYPALWITVMAVCAAVCAVSAIFGVRGVLKPMPAELMRARLPSGGRLKGAGRTVTFGKGCRSIPVMRSRAPCETRAVFGRAAGHVRLLRAAHVRAGVFQFG